jgi:RNA-directed DNA polymerase
MYIVRYADDFKIFCRDHKSAHKKYNAVRLHLEISADKSKITNLRKNYTEFLGFKLKATIKGNKHVCKSHISDKAKKKIVIKLKEKIDEIRKQPITLDYSYI